MLGKDPAFSYSFFQTLKFTVTFESLQDAEFEATDALMAFAPYWAL